MRIHNGFILFAASDLINFAGCRHSTFLDLRSLNSREPQATDAQAELLKQKGLDHERAFLATLTRQRRSVAEIPADRALDNRIEETRRAMHAGAEVIYQ